MLYIHVAQIVQVVSSYNFPSLAVYDWLVFNMYKYVGNWIIVVNDIGILINFLCVAENAKNFVLHDFMGLLFCVAHHRAVYVEGHLE